VFFDRLAINKDGVFPQIFYYVATIFYVDSCLMSGNVLFWYADITIFRTANENLFRTNFKPGFRFS